MSLARRGLWKVSNSFFRVPVQCRYASSTNANHNEHHEGDHYQYPKEGFGGVIWRNTLLFSVLAVATYKYAPEANEDAYLTRWIAMYSTPRDFWLERNVEHTAQEAAVSELNIILGSAEKPKVHRYRYPQMFDQASPFLNAVGMNVDSTGMNVKGDRDII